MSLYEHYLKERRGLSVFRNESAFLTWKLTDDNGAYIQDIYAIPDARRMHIASHLTDEFVVWLKGHAPACDKLYGSVDFTANAPEGGLIAMLRYGFKWVRMLGDSGMLLRKDL